MKASRYLAAAAGLGASLALAACALIPPTLPDYPKPATSMWLEQGWTSEVRNEYHQADQGTLTFGIPYEWFAALEQPAVLGEAPPFGDLGFLDRFGFIPGQNGLPVGFARAAVYRDPTAGKTWDNPATGKPFSGLGLTCAACHTGRMTYKGAEFRVDGGSAMTHLGDFRSYLGIALAETELLPWRFKRFADRVVGADASDAARDTLRQQLKDMLAGGEAELALVQKHAPESSEEGFGRLDAINRIGNQVFGLDMYPGLPAGTNYEATSAPVHFPHIWTASWFTWVQYNGSIMQPMVRNAGEALGVRALMNVSNPDRPLFDSTVQIPALQWIETALAGTGDPMKARTFPGLRSPAWPDSLPPIDRAKAEKGAALYKDRCQGCHLPPINTEAFWTGPWWKQIQGKGPKYVDLVQIPVSHIGTDPAQARGMKDRTVALPERLKALTGDQAFKSNGFGPALGQLVQNVTNEWYDTQTPPISPAKRDEMNGGRPNLLQVPLEYKARPLNGIWAAPPYLHNGAVPSLYALLSPVSERPATFTLGNREFDPVKVGYVETAMTGGFTLDTSKPGNRNTGHEFRDAPKGGGVIGPALSPEERLSLIEFLKTL